MLSLNWITEKTLDFEYKKYRLLAYLQKVDGWFQQNKLFPNYKEVQLHCDNLLTLKEQKETFSQNLPKNLTGINWQKMQLEYKSNYKQPQHLKAVEKIVDYALPKLSKRAEHGNEIYGLVEESIQIQPIGILPLYKKEGYILLPVQPDKSTYVYQYKISAIEAEKETETIVYTQHRYTWNYTITSSVQSQLSNLNPDLPVPAAWLAESSMAFPVNETLLPVVKRILCKQILEI